MREYLKILLVEDNPGDVRLLKELLSETTTSFELINAKKLSEALHYLNYQSFDVVLLDLSLPDSKGLDTFTNIHMQGFKIPIIVLSGLNDETIAVKAMKEGAQDYLVKGQVNGDLVLRSIKYAIERHRMLAEREHYALALKAREANFRNLIVNNMDGMVIFDKLGKTKFVNPAAKNLLGQKVTKLIENLFFTLTTGNRREIEITFSQQTIECRVIETEWEGEKCYLASLRDITNRKYAEFQLLESKRSLEKALQELKNTQQQVLQQERLRALGQMASGIAHDFNNALMPISGFCQLLLISPEKLKDTKKARHFLNLISTAAQDATNVVKRLREFYRYRSANEIFLAVNLNKLIRQVTLLTRPKWRDLSLAKGVTINIELDLQKIPLVLGSETQLREVITNLIFNAADAMTTDGVIKISTYCKGKNVCFKVKDTGVGMTEEVRQRCLEPFFSTKKDRGTGMGLAIVYGVLKRHKGYMEIDSLPHMGTTFSISLPQHISKETKKAGEELPSINEPSQILSHPLHILLVEDEPTARDLIGEYLNCEGYTFEMATNGAEGLEKFKENNFDIVITDRAMPEMSGDQLAHAIKQFTPDIPIVMLTGFGDMMQASGEKPDNIDILLSKPIKLADLQSLLANFALGKLNTALQSNKV